MDVSWLLNVKDRIWKWKSQVYLSLTLSRQPTMAIRTFSFKLFRVAIPQSIKHEIKNEKRFFRVSTSVAKKNDHQNLLNINDVEINEASINMNVYKHISPSKISLSLAVTSD